MNTSPGNGNGNGANIGTNSGTMGRPGSARALSPRSLLSRMTTLRSNRSGGSRGGGGSVNGNGNGRLRPLHTPAGGKAVVIGQIGGGGSGSTVLSTNNNTDNEAGVEEG